MPLEFGSCEISARIMLSSGKFVLLFVGEHKVVDVFFYYGQKLCREPTRSGFRATYSEAVR